jgi:hypothetical protein
VLLVGYSMFGKCDNRDGAHDGSSRGLMLVVLARCSTKEVVDLGVDSGVCPERARTSRWYAGGVADARAFVE